MSKFHPSALYSADKQMFICTCAEQHQALVAAGWTDSPAYPGGEATWRKRFDDVVLEAPKPERVVGADTDGDGVIDRVFRKKPGRPKKD